MALGVSIGPASGYILSRSIGLPHYADDIGNWTEPLGVASLIVEGSLFGCALIALVADHRVFAAELRGLIHHSSPGTDPTRTNCSSPPAAHIGSGAEPRSPALNLTCPRCRARATRKPTTTQPTHTAKRNGSSGRQQPG